jgi:PilZ domain
MSLFWQERRFRELHKNSPRSESPERNVRPEFRQSQRYEVNYLAHVDPDMGSSFNCIICELSSGGAKLIVDARHRLPNEFTLVFRRRCRIVHRTDGKTGVQFVP